jgi:DNA helicase-2/ATP-dependent DNA helicase PcrA
MYVAATRAKENLFIVYPAQAFDRATGMTLFQPSRFIDGLPEDILQKKIVGSVQRRSIFDYDDYFND